MLRSNLARIGSHIDASRSRWAQPGDVVRCAIEGIGALENTVRAERV